MSHDVYYQFPATPGQARRDGPTAEGPQPEAGAPLPVPRESTAAAIRLLDAQYPWLRGAEKRFWNRSHGEG